MKKNNNYEHIIKRIENIRKKNNVNWMDILRISMKYSPRETMNVMKKIHHTDNKISKLFNKFKIK
ncbi:MAG: hypothetical protein FD544_000236 [Pelagibacterales bacterium]|nr:hypothetical protein [Pelagibacterales bacterium]|tara:strand:+ start:295 stop:489 length:195 start_codon:yes stop_codon:yes gene_type:complete